MSESSGDPKSYSKFYVYSLVFNACIGSFQIGYELGILNQFQLYLSNDLFNWTQAQSNLYVGLLGAMIPLGAVIGSLFAGPLAQGIGRRMALIITSSLAIFGIFLSIFVNYPLMLVGWFLSGVCVGLNTMVASLYCNEVSPVAIRSVSGCIFSICMNTGILVAYTMGYGLPFPYGGETSSFWRFMIIFPVFLIAPQVLLLLFVFTKDTPKYLVQHHRNEEAKEILRKIYSGSEQMVKEHYDMLIAERDLDLHAAKVTFTDLFTRKYRHRTAVGVGVSVLTQLTGAYVILTYSTTIFLGDAYTTDAIPTLNVYDKALTLTVLLGFLELLGSIVAAYLMDYMGRKDIMLWGFVAMVLTYLVFEVFLIGIWAEISILVFIIVVNIAIGTVMWVYLPEVLPDVGVAFALQLFWIVYAALVFVFPMFVAATSIRFAIGVFLAGNVIGIIFTAIWILETKDKTNDEIIEMYCPTEFLDHGETGEESQAIITPSTS